MFYLHPLALKAPQIAPEAQAEPGFTGAAVRSGASTVPSSDENVKIKA